MRPPVELEATILSGFPVLAQGVDSSVYCLDHALGPFARHQEPPVPLGW